MSLPRFMTLARADQILDRGDDSPLLRAVVDQKGPSQIGLKNILVEHLHLCSLEKKIFDLSAYNKFSVPFGMHSIGLKSILVKTFTIF